MKKSIYWRRFGDSEIYSDLAVDYNTDNLSEEELEDLCDAWEKEDAENGDPCEYFLLGED